MLGCMIVNHMFSGCFIHFFHASYVFIFSFYELPISFYCFSAVSGSPCFPTLNFMLLTSMDWFDY
jgi:hypothetical protein